MVTLCKKITDHSAFQNFITVVFFVDADNAMAIGRKTGLRPLPTELAETAEAAE